MSLMGRAAAVRAVKVKDLSSTEISAGATPLVDFGTVIDGQDSSRRYAHLVGIEVAATIGYTSSNSGMPTALPGYMLASIFQNVRLTAGGREFIRNLNLAELWKLFSLRDRTTHLGWPANISKGDATASASIRVPLYFGPKSHRWGRGLDGAIPIAALDGRKDPTSGLRFTIGSASAPFSQGGTAFAGFSSTTVTAATIYAIVAYDTNPHVDAWLAEGFLETRQDIVYQQSDGGYLSFFGAAEEYNGSSWTAGLTTYSNIQVQAGGDYSERLVSYGDLIAEYNLEDLDNVGGDYSLANGGGSGSAGNQLTANISESAPWALPFVRQVPGQQRTNHQTGPVRVQFVRTNAASFMLAFARTIQDEGMIRKVADACGVPATFQTAGTSGMSPAQERRLGRALPSRLVAAR